MSNDQKSAAAQKEAEILQYWEDNNIFEKTLQKESPEGEFVFYDGPPFATGTPHYGHILAGTIKDVIPRFRTMQGYHVERQWGWDTHGLPLENQVEDHLDLSTKKDIAEYGIEKFNEVAKDFVLEYADQWKRIIPRTGRWVDMEHDYRTMDPDYTESIWWAFSELEDKGLVYEGFKSMQICPRCETPLSNFEVNQGYTEQKDIAVTVKLPLADEPETNLLIWTTTPWTLPGNMAVAVNPELAYAKVSFEDEVYIVAKEMLEEVFADEDYEILEELAGDDLVGRSYQPPFDYFADKDIDNKDKAWKIYGADFVTLEEGTGLVHIAPAFGADDLSLAESQGVPIIHHVTESGEFTEDVEDFAGMKVKPRDEGDEEHLLADIEILKYIAEDGTLFEKENVHHQYPLCWRCDTPLLNYATNSWFVEVSSFKDKLVSENEAVGWTPEAIGKNRFGNWLEGARDWAISRERFWGAPLPVWKSEDGEDVTFISSVDELKEKTQSSNSFLALRHGEAESNVKGIITRDPEGAYPLTDKGKEETKAAASKLADAEVDAVYSSPVLRTRQTAELLQSDLGLDDDQVVFDERLSEIDPGAYDGKTLDEYHAQFDELSEALKTPSDGGESFWDVRRRVGEFLYEINDKHKDETIVILSHSGPLWMLFAAAEGADEKETNALYGDRDTFIETGVPQELDFAPIPHNDDYELDFHRPYIDEVTWENDDGQQMTRIDSVFDCWFESGSMSYASKHYPFDTSEFDPETGDGYPANFVAEGLDQTRGWFYSSLVLGVGLFDQSPYENVIVNGLVMAEDGQKMSKSKENYPPVTEMLNEYSADALRFFLINSPLVRGENVSLSKDEVDEVMKKVMYRITNTYSFVEMYADPDERTAALAYGPADDHVLDRWILTRLDELTRDVTTGLENYELDKAAQPITTFVDDLSTWYLRRSRDRIRENEDADDRKQALGTLLYTLKQLSLVLAPFMPFLAESLYQDVTAEAGKESVHLEDWPTARGTDQDQKLLENMSILREAASHAHDLRSQNQLKVRQPLAELTLRSEALEGDQKLLSILADEVNVEAISFDSALDEPAALDTELTDTLKEKGAVRELVRNIQRLRKQAELDPSEEITLTIETDQVGQDLVGDYADSIRIPATVTDINFTDATGGSVVDVHDFHFEVEIS